MTRVALAVGMLGALLARPPRASACTPPFGVYARTVVPEDGATGVPRNARVLVNYDGSVPDGTLELRTQSGEAVAATITGGLITPTTALAASATYELYDTLILPCDSDEASDCLGAATLIATFTTAESLDTTPPVIGGITVTSDYTCIANSCPEGESVVLDHIAIAERDDDFAPSWIRYQYLDADGVVLVALSSMTTIGRNCEGPGYVPFEPYLRLPSQVQIAAVDLAGNVELTPHAIDGSTCALIGDGCDPAPDAGPGGELDGGPGAEGGGDAGCGCHASSPSSTALLVIVLVLAWTRRRTRTQ
jgi:MYXO-CTERM domain-containing protein